jgi:hypothetical protein
MTQTLLYELNHAQESLARGQHVPHSVMLKYCL